MGDSVASLHADLGLETARFNSELAAAEVKLTAAAERMQVPIERISHLIDALADGEGITTLQRQFVDLRNVGLETGEALAAISQAEMSRERANAELQRELAAAQKKEIAEQLKLRSEAAVESAAKRKAAEDFITADIAQQLKAREALEARLRAQDKEAGAEAVAQRLAAEKAITEGIAEQLAARAAMEARARKAKAELDAGEAAEKTLFNRTITQTGYLAGGSTGGHAASALTTMSPAIAGIVGGGLAIAYATKLSIDFDKALTQNTANMKGMADGMKEQLGAAALDISSKYPIAAEKVAEAFKGMKESGYSAAESLAYLPTFAKYAIATNTDLTTSIEHLRAVQHGFGLENANAAENQKSLARVSDLLVTAERQGGESADKYAKALAAVGPEARKMGVNIFEAAAAIGILGLQNVEGARSGEVLSRVIITITNANEKHRQMWKDLGVEIYETNTTKLLPLSQLMANLAKVIGTNDPAMNAFNSNLLGLSTRSDKLVASLLQQNAALRDGAAAFGQIEGATGKVVALRLDNFSDQFHILAGSMKKDAIELTTPLVQLSSEILKLMVRLKELKDLPPNVLDAKSPTGLNLKGVAGVAMKAIDLILPGGNKDLTQFFPPSAPKPIRTVAQQATHTPPPTTHAEPYDPTKISSYVDSLPSAADSVANQQARAAAEDFAANHVKSLPVLRKELTDIEREIVSLNRLLGNTEHVIPMDTRSAMTETLSKAEAKRDSLKASIDEITGKTQAKIEAAERKAAAAAAKAASEADAEAARQYREDAQEITNWENHQKKLLEIQVKSETGLAENDEKSIDANRDRLIKYEADVIAITIAANAKRLALDKSSKTGDRQDSQLGGAIQGASDDFSVKELAIIERADAAKAALRKQEAEKVQKELERQTQEKRRQDEIQLNDEIKAEQDDIHHRAESSQRRLELTRSEYRQKEQLGEINLQTLLNIERRLDAEEYNLQRDALTHEIELLAQKQGFDRTAASHKEALEAQLRKLLDDRAAKEQSYVQQEIAGVDSLARERVKLITEQNVLNDLSAHGASQRIAELNELQIGTKLLEIRVRGAGGAYMEMTKSVEQALGGVGHTLAEGIMDPKNFTKNWKSALHSMETQVLGTVLQSWLKLGVAQIATVTKHAAAVKTADALRKEAMAEQLVQIKAVAAAQILADQSVMESKAALLSDLDASTIVAAKAVALAEVMDAAAVGGAWATSSTAAIPIYGPAIALQAGLAMQSAIQGAFGASLVATLSDGGDVPHDMLSMVHGGEHMLNRDITAELYKAIDNGGLGGGGGTHFDFSHANFSGSHVTESSIKRIMTNMLDQLRRAGGATHTKRGRL